MVQLSVLENLTAISDLLSGRLPALPDVPSASASSASSPVAAETAVVSEKKNVEVVIAPAVKPPIPTDVLPELEDDDGVTEEDDTTSEVELTRETCRALLEPLVKSVGLKISAGLSRASDLLLVAPNRMEIVLDSSFDFARKILDQPENRARIESELQTLTGRLISVNVRLIAPQRPTPEVGGHTESAVGVASVQDTAEGSRPNPNSSSRRSSRSASPPAPVQQRNMLGEVDPAGDPFVRQVIAAFGGTVVKVTVAPSVQISDNELQP
jgi:hypothetical protein